ncbi:hypothetical protein SCARD494_06952 [Seiridium cardinale]
MEPAIIVQQHNPADNRLNSHGLVPQPTCSYDRYLARPIAIIAIIIIIVIITMASPTPTAAVGKSFSQPAASIGTPTGLAAVSS